MGTIVIDRQLAHRIVTAFRQGNVYLRSVIPQLGQACMIRVIDFIGNVQEAELTFCMERVTFKLTVEARDLLIKVDISGDPWLFTKEIIKSAAQQVRQETLREAAKTTLASTAKTAFGCSAIVESAFLSIKLLQDYKKMKDGEISQEEFGKRALRYSVGAAVSLIGSTAGAVIGATLSTEVGTIVGSMVGGIIGGVAGGSVSGSIIYKKKAIE